MVWVKINYKQSWVYHKENAEDLFRTYHDKVPFVKMLMESVMRRAQDRGRNKNFTRSKM